MDILERDLLATLQYFDLFDHPLTLMELARYRYVSAGPVAAPALSEILSALSSSGAGTRDGFWFLPGREAVVATRQRRHRMSEAKFRRARRAATLMSLLPSVRMVAVCNSLALANADVESDIDFFVVTRPGTIWSTRLLLVGALALLGMRPNARTSADKLCMSFFVTERALGLQPLMLKPDDTYLRYWIASMVPLYDAGGVVDAFLAANRWVAQRVPGALVPRRAPQAGASRISLLPNALLRVFDPTARTLQRKMFPRSIREAQEGDTNVVVSDDILKFHTEDRRAEFEKRFRERIGEMQLAKEEIREVIKV